MLTGACLSDAILWTADVGVQYHLYVVLWREGTCIFEWLSKRNWYYFFFFFCEKTNKAKQNTFFIWGACFSWDIPTFCEKAEEFERTTLESFVATTSTNWIFVVVLKFLYTVLKFSAKEMMSGTSSHLYSNEYFCMFQEAKNQTILVLKEGTYSLPVYLLQRKLPSLLQKVMQW